MVMGSRHLPRGVDHVGPDHDAVGVVLVEQLGALVVDEQHGVGIGGPRVDVSGHDVVVSAFVAGQIFDDLAVG